MSRARTLVQLAALLVAALAPLFRHQQAPLQLPDTWPPFPDAIAGRALQVSPSSELEAPWIAAFPGRIGRFSDGERLWILRQVASATLALHSSVRCLTAAGWSVAPAQAWRDAEGRTWSSCRARLGERTALVRERVESSSTGASWPDVDAWRHDAWLGRDPGPWCAFTSIELDPAD
jgi:hypothetical protein